MSKNVAIILAGIAACLILVLVVAFVFLLGEVTPDNGDVIAGNGDSGSISAAATANSETAVAATETADAAPTATETAEPTDLPAPPVLPTDTPMPTEAPTDTPEPTPTPEATTTPEPTATATNAPVVILPTNTPVPPTSPPPPTAVPVNTRGLSGSFSLLPESQYTVNGNIWFRFTVTNSSGQNVPYEALGALPKKNGVVRGDWFKRSWGGNNDSIGTGGLTADDWIKLPETGNYTLMLAVCFDPLSACQSGASPWVILSPEVPVTIN